MLGTTRGGGTSCTRGEGLLHRHVKSSGSPCSTLLDFLLLDELSGRWAVAAIISTAASFCVVCVDTPTSGADLLCKFVGHFQHSFSVSFYVLVAEVEVGLSAWLLVALAAF